MAAGALLAVSWFTQDHRVFGLDWSYLTLLGLLGNAVFSTRFLVQWIASERKGESVIPVSFWHWSIWGSIIMCAYWMCERKPVGILAYLPNVFIYVRNLHLIRKKRISGITATHSKQDLRS
ncbi:MAG: lipid-A-disaccharide synthase N-terminal domain-containing protein [Verrucomicrobiae bacterium]|nr:lipid-A-disaccharide synthase N-terminal domain-containing protein [Verrucomicrobiae bacterium]